ncbi:vesicular, overexpressed in cancer, prosurvival protein 1-like [Lingula anatina]|uniref:WW domain binding protein VOPP1 n=1 Tax=Lingula anatina TaxID=7574 RepID=A0A1S3HX87_LINAN|nr:vesicular, overexpressed in cancer, prosurvival protein 1-like [Lingula anatina]|eukprot:XP_013389684.1 vesicular, overexpressed in cancer, prosurvival protein 1-like [Lingula anatina]
MSLSTVIQILLVFLGNNILQVAAEFCQDFQRYCDYGCCSEGCCSYDGYYYSWSIWNMWYFWFIIIFILLSCFGACGYWRRRQWMLAQQRTTTAQQGHLFIPSMDYTNPAGPQMYPYGGPYPQQQAQGNFPSPPPYAEVISKPDAYPPSKQDLPPYPGEPVVTAATTTENTNTAVNSQQQVSSGAAAIPQPPPYQPSSTPPVTDPAAQNPELVAVITSHT